MIHLSSLGLIFELFGFSLLAIDAFVIRYQDLKITKFVDIKEQIANNSMIFFYNYSEITNSLYRNLVIIFGIDGKIQSDIATKDDIEIRDKALINIIDKAKNMTSINVELAKKDVNELQKQADALSYEVHKIKTVTLTLAILGTLLVVIGGGLQVFEAVFKI